MATHGLLVFDHIPKTAGTTFRRSYLTAALPAAERWILGGGETNARDRERFLSLPSAQRDRIRVVAGHEAGSMRPELPGARFITVVRDPIQRAISSYLHARFHEGGEKLWPDVREQLLSLAQFAQRYIPPNYQSRVVLGDDYEGLDADRIRQRLSERYALVGYTEAFDEFVYLLHEIEGLPLCPYANRLVRPERESYVPATAAGGGYFLLRFNSFASARRETKPAAKSFRIVGLRQGRGSPRTSCLPMHLDVNPAQIGLRLAGTGSVFAAEVSPSRAAALKRTCDRAELATLPGAQLPPG